MNEFLSGAFMLASAAVAVFFVQYWRKTRDRLFAIFAVAFALIAFERTLLAFVSVELEGRHWMFLVRLLAFVLILIGILDKNRVRRRAEQDRARPAPRAADDHPVPRAT